LCAQKKKVKNKKLLNVQETSKNGNEWFFL
jgi:hypothetical protein